MNVYQRRSRARFSSTVGKRPSPFTAPEGLRAWLYAAELDTLRLRVISKLEIDDRNDRFAETVRCGHRADGSGAAGFGHVD